MQTRHVVLVGVGLILLGYVFVIISFFQTSPQAPVITPPGIVVANSVVKQDTTATTIPAANIPPPPVSPEVKDIAPATNLRGNSNGNGVTAPIVLVHPAAAAASTPAVTEKAIVLTKKAQAEAATEDKSGSGDNKEGAPASKTFHFMKPIAPGVVILGMHRSGTSVLGGLMNKMGLPVGGPLIPANFDNEKGFFERIDVVLMNDELMKEQRVHYAWSTVRFDPNRALKEVLIRRNDNTSKFFNEGERALKFLNNPSNYPWMLKDPRLCITIRTWLPLLQAIPAIVFTYRHPFDVAMSMHKRETEQFPIGRAMRLWYIYNKRAIQQSNDLCRVVTSHRLVMNQPGVELTRIYNELRDNCGVAVPRVPTTAEINDFIDLKLQHGLTTLVDSVCSGGPTSIASATPPEAWGSTQQDHVRLYRSSLKLYCAMEEGSAFAPGFVFDESIRDD